MSIPPAGPGKTAPKLFDDFLSFDPLNAKGSILADHPPSQGEGQQIHPIGTCKHDYATKADQSLSPPLDGRPDGATKYKIAAVCKKCRIHATVKIDYSRATNACPNSDYPLHHFQRLKTEDAITTDRIRYFWQCSAPQCQARLEISYRQGRLSPKEVDLLTNTELLKRRYEATVADDPSRDGVKQATPVDALNRLRSYTRDGLTRHRRSLPANNKRFMEAFGVDGQDCRVFLERLGFEYAHPNWLLPDPPDVTDVLEADGGSQRELLQDVLLELQALMVKLASETGSINPAATESWPSANRDVERVLAAQGFQRYVAMRRSASANDEPSYFASLGALSDFADNLIIFAYERQANCDPEQQRYYLECLQVIAKSRDTEALQLKVAMLQSDGQYSRRDLSAAYSFLDIRGAESSTDDYILNVFQSRQQSVSESVAAQNRDALYKIGASRNSVKLMNAAQQSVDSYEDALAFLNATRDMTDDWLINLSGAKDSEHDKEIARKALATIARERKSNYINDWLLTGQTGNIEMGVDEALRMLDIQEKLNELHPEVLQTLLVSARSDNPSEQKLRAIETIERALAGANTTASSEGNSNWPVGLVSHGNTCYLNSLLQYYFAVKPFRDIILGYDEYKMDTTGDVKKSERVGQLPVSPVEIKGGQRFAKDLQELFRRMIKDPHRTVKPEADLVCRAFLHPKDYHLLPSSWSEKEANASNGAADGADAKMEDVAAAEDTGGVESSKARHQSDASSVTLQASADGEDEDAPTTVKGDDDPSNPPPEAEKPAGKQEQPNHAPPLPPRIRRFSTSEDIRKAEEDALKKATDNAREQQDVTEVHDSVMWRLRTGMKAKGTDHSGEQIDSLREQYAIAMTETTIADGSSKSTSTQLAESAIQLAVPGGPTDLYTALDNVFDLQQRGDQGNTQSYKTVQKLPAILQISVPRIGFNREKKETFKDEWPFKIEDVLYMDQYCDNSDTDVLERRKRCWGWRRQLREVQKEQKMLKDAPKDMDGPTAVTGAADYLKSLDGVNKILEDVEMEGVEVDAELSGDLNSVADLQTERLAELEKESSDLNQKLDGQFDDLKAIKYRLGAVFIHRGSHGGGHYWIFIRDFATGIWRKYNDETVAEITGTDINQIFHAKEWVEGTPTYLVYVEESRKEELIVPLCRDPDPMPEPEAAPAVSLNDGDVPMKDDDRPKWKHVDSGTVQEGGGVEWDQPRQVGSTAW